MSLPTNRESFKRYCLYNLGAPVINIEIDDDQVDDRVDEALKKFADYHFEGADAFYYKYKLTHDDIINKYITMPDNIIGVVDLFPIGQGLNTANMFNIRYQIALNDLYTLTSVSMVPYYMAFQHIQFLEMILVGQQPLRYTRSRNILYIDQSWDLVNVGDYIIVKAYQIVDPDEYPRMWNDSWLMRYGTALLKRQWGANIGTKYRGIPMPGGMVFNDNIVKEAMQEIKELEYELHNSWSLPACDMIGNKDTTILNILISIKKGITWKKRDMNMLDVDLYIFGTIEDTENFI
jgi:hypothetical protein